MFSQLSDSIVSIIKGIKGRGVISDGDIDDVLRRVRIALLESDVSLAATKKLTQAVKEKIAASETIAKMASAQALIDLLHDEIVELLGGQAYARAKLKEKAGAAVNANSSAAATIITAGDRDNAASDTASAVADIITERSKGKVIEKLLNLAAAKQENRPAVLLLLGLQGSGKTTTAAKLAACLQKEVAKKVLLVSFDIYRPAAYEQLATLAKNNGIDLLERGAQSSIDGIIAAYRKFMAAHAGMYDCVVVDTAGRTVCDPEMMAEIELINQAFSADEVLLVTDSLLGQSAVSVAAEFHRHAAISGIILTRVDSDAKGGAALSLKTALDVPIKFIADGEKVGDFSPFEPERIASLIVGMGDLQAIIEKTEASFKEVDTDKLKSGKTDFDDILSQLHGIKKMGNMKNILGMLPAMSGIKDKIKQVDGDKGIDSMIAIINSMTKKERRHPHLVIRDHSRRKRICRGSGRSNRDMENLIKFYQKTKEVLAKVSKMGDGVSVKGLMKTFFPGGGGGR